MFAVVVDVVAKKEYAEQFKAAVCRQGENSLSKEKGCLRFDVLQDPEAPERFTLYEVYTDKETFYEVHRKTPHFAQYAEATGPMVESKNVRAFAKLKLAGDR
jgi:autoinducer 2-degrading protein